MIRKLINWFKNATEIETGTLGYRAKRNIPRGDTVAISKGGINPHPPRTPRPPPLRINPEALKKSYLFQDSCECRCKCRGSRW